MVKAWLGYIRTKPIWTYFFDHFTTCSNHTKQARPSKEQLLCKYLVLCINYSPTQQHILEAAQLLIRFIKTLFSFSLDALCNWIFNSFNEHWHIYHINPIKTTSNTHCSCSIMEEEIFNANVPSCLQLLNVSVWTQRCKCNIYKLVYLKQYIGCQKCISFDESDMQWWYASITSIFA